MEILDLCMLVLLIKKIFDFTKITMVFIRNVQQTQVYRFVQKYSKNGCLPVRDDQSSSNFILQICNKNTQYATLKCS